MSLTIESPTGRGHRSAAIAATLFMGLCGATHADDAAIDVARVHYESGHYQLAFAHVAVLADSGHCEAARLAREMARHGPRLYGTRFDVARERLARWYAVPGCDTPSPALAVVAAP